MRSEFGIYGVDSDQICVAALNSKNIYATVAAIVKVLVRVHGFLHRPRNVELIGLQHESAKVRAFLDFVIEELGDAEPVQARRAAKRRR